MVTGWPDVLFWLIIHIARSKKMLEIVERQDEFCGISGLKQTTDLARYLKRVIKICQSCNPIGLFLAA